MVTDVGSVKGLPLDGRDRRGGRDRARPLRRQPPDGRQRALGSAGGERGPVRRPAVGDHARTCTPRRRPWRSSRRWPGSAAPSRCASRPSSTTARWPAPRTCRTCSPSLTAGQLAEAQPEHLSLSGQGVRDVTRIAAGDPDTVGADHPRPTGRRSPRSCATSRATSSGCSTVLDAADGDALGEILARGVSGTRAIPGKHGGPALATASVFVSVPDHPGELARLFADVGEIGVNIEDVHIDHDPGRPIGPASSSSSPRPPPSSCATSLEARELGHAPVGLLLCSAGGRVGSTVVVAMDGTVGIGQVEHVARSGDPARPALPRHRRPVPRRDRRGCSTTTWTSTTPTRSLRRADEPRLESGTDPLAPTITLDGIDVSARVRSQEVTDHVSAVASVPAVRQRLLELQRRIIEDAGPRRHRRRGPRHRLGRLAAGCGEGLPDRRPRGASAPPYGGERGGHASRRREADLLRRDRIDSGRAVAPAVAPDGAVHLDTTPYTPRRGRRARSSGLVAARGADEVGLVDGARVSIYRVRCPAVHLLVRRPSGASRCTASRRVPPDGRRRDGGQPRRLARRAAARDLLAATGARPDQAGDVLRTRSARSCSPAGRSRSTGSTSTCAPIHTALQALRGGPCRRRLPGGRARCR